MKINPNELSKETIEKALACKTPEELMTLAKAEGYELTRDEAEAYLGEMADVELTDVELKKAAGGACWWKKCSEIICDSYCIKDDSHEICITYNGPRV